MTSNPTLILEAIIQKNEVTMSIYERGSTVHQYEEISISLPEIKNYCEEIIKLLNKANEAGKLASGIALELKKVGQVLYDQLLTEGVKRKLKNTEIEDLLIHLDEGLVQIPWELLFDGKQFLCLKFNVGRSVKTRQSLRDSGQRTMGFPIKMLVLADPTGDLKAARQEAGVIEKELDKTRKFINVGKKVTNINTSYIKKNLRDYDIVHYAGHADYDIKNPSNSGWKLEDGRFTAKDISSMGATAPLPSLIFSNSCQSAHTKEWIVNNNFEEEIFGLANAFLCSGVRHYIGASWKVPDDIGLCFAKEFYSQIAQGGSVGSSIRKTRLRIIKDFGEDTIVWASYVLYGDPTTSVFSPPTVKRDVSKYLVKKRIPLAIGSMAVILFGFILVFIKYNILQPPAAIIKANINENTIAVLPFENLSKDSENIGSGIAEVIITKLSNLKQIKIVDKSLVDKTWSGIKDTEKYNKIWSQFGAKTIVMGAYQKMGDKIRITAKLVDSSNGQVIDTTETFGLYQDIFALQDTIAFNILAKLNVEITEKEKITIKETNPTKNLSAFEYFAKSNEHFNRGDNVTALELCKKAIELDPEYIQANFGIAQIYEKMNNWGLAKPFYEKTKNLAEKQKDKNILLTAYHNFGRFAGVAGDYKTALEYEQKALDIAKEINSQQSYALILRHMAIAFMGLNQNEKALNAVMESKRIFEESNNIAAMGEVYFTLGLIYSFVENMDREKGIEYLEKALKIYESIQYKEGVLKILMSLGSPYVYKIGQYDKAVEYLNKAVVVANELNSRTDEISIYNILADIATRKEEYGAAEGYYRKALEINKGINDKAYADTLYWLAQLNMRQLKHENAITYLQQLVDFCEEKKNYDVLYKSKSEIANAYMAMGRYKDSMEILEEIDTNIGKISDKLTRNNIKLNLLRAYFKSGNYKKGENIIEEVAALAREISAENISYKPHEAYVLSQIASLYSERSMFDDAIAWYNKSMEVFSSALQDDYSKGILVSVYYGIANCYKATKNYEKAKEFYNKVLPIALQVDSPIINSIKSALYSLGAEEIFEKEIIANEEASVLYNKALRLFQEGDFKTAIELTRKANKIEPGNRLILKQLALSLELDGNSDEAIQIHNEYIKLLDTQKEKDKIAEEFAWIGFIKYSKGDLKTAQEYIDKALLLAIEIGSKKTSASIYSDASRIYEALDQDEKAIEFAEKGIALSEGVKVNYPNAYQTLAFVYSKRKDIKKAIEYGERYLEKAQESGAWDLGPAYSLLGNLYADTDIIKTIEYLNKSIEQFKKHNNLQPLGNAYHTIGSVYEKSRQIDKALEFYNKSLEISERLNDKWTTLANYLGLEGAYFESKDYKLSADFRNKYEILSKELGKEEELGLVYGAVGSRYEDIDKAEAERYFILSNQILEKYKSHRSLESLFINYNALGYMYYKGKDFDKAMSCFQKAIDVSGRENSVDQFMLAFAYKNLGDCSRVKGNYETTLNAYKTAKTIFIEQKAEQRIIDTLDNEIKKLEHVIPALAKAKNYDDLVAMAIAYHKEHKWELAIEYYKKALTIADESKESGKDEEIISNMSEREKWLSNEIIKIESYLKEIETSKKTKPAEYLEANAILYIRQNKFDAALENLAKALSIYEGADYKKQVGFAKMRIGLVYLTKGDLDQADKSFQEAKVIANKTEDKEFKGIIHGVFGILFEKKGELNKAEKEYDEAISLLKETESEKIYTAAYNNCLGSINYKKKDYKKSLDYYQKALEAGKEIEDPNSICLTNTMIAYINFIRSSFQEANDTADSALAIAESLDDKEIASIVSLIKAKILIKENNYEEAKEFINKALGYSEMLENNKLKLVMYLNLAMLAEMQNDSAEYGKWVNKAMENGGFNCVINGKVAKDREENLLKEIIEEKDFFKRIWL